ncbi:MAG TPA: GNAT family N-acetyltransferase [Acidobacteriaceae bacterium]|nr:GNAT family N-acetyltransferase [Acidobacteriaceae bacterium]
MEIQPLLPPPWHLLTPLIEASTAEGLHFLVRLKDEYLTGQKCFNAPGETLLGAYHQAELLGVCGLTKDPYSNAPNTGRIRHLYVHPSTRSQGIGSQLVRTIEQQAARTFTSLVLRTDSEAAFRFYIALGYEPTPESTTATHRLVIGHNMAPQG